MQSSYKIVYAFNGVKWLWRQLLLSIITLRKYVKDNTIVFYGPPRFQEHIDWLESRCDLRLVEPPLNDSEFKAERKYFRGEYWGLPMKLHAYAVDTPTMITLDCDTVIQRNPLEILNLNGGQYDAAVAEWPDPRGKLIMKKNCQALGLPHWPLMMDGFLIFKNGAHLKFRPIYEKYLRMVALGKVTPHDSTHLGVHAINLALAHFRRDGFNVIRMPRDYHTLVRGREAERKKAKYVTHLVHKHFAIEVENQFFSKELHKLKDIGA